MKNKINILFLFIMLLIVTLPSSAVNYFRYTVDPHDSLLFDGESAQPLNIFAFSDNLQCYTRVVEIKGAASGKVLKREIGIFGCGSVVETVYVSVEKFLEKGDMLLPGSEVVTGPASKLSLGMFLMESGFNSVYLDVGPSSQITTPNFFTCKVKPVETQEPLPEEKILIIQGTVTYDAEPDAKIKATTKGKRSSVKHTKTRYSHEVKIDGNDTLDIIRVYKGSVEVTFMKTDDSDEEEITKKIEKLGEDMQSGKITAEELQAKMTEFQNYGQNLSERLTPLEVNEGSKCIVTKNSRTVEPLGPGDEDSK